MIAKILVKPSLQYSIYMHIGALLCAIASTYADIFKIEIDKHSLWESSSADRLSALRAPCDLQLFHLHGKRRLRNVQLRSRAGEALQFGDLEECTDMPQFVCHRRTRL